MYITNGYIFNINGTLFDKMKLFDAYDCLNSTGYQENIPVRMVCFRVEYKLNVTYVLDY